jgi:hypothetical protein
LHYPRMVSLVFQRSCRILHIFYTALQPFLKVFFCFFLFISIVYSSSEILSSTCSRLLVWLSTLGFFELRKLVPGFLFDPFLWVLSYLC